MNDLRILFFDQPPFFQAVAVVLAALGLILTLGIVDEAIGYLVLTRWLPRFRARRNLDRVVRIERQDRRRRELNAVSRSGGRS